MVRRKTLPPRNILVVEDDDFFVNVFKHALEKRSFNVIAENSYEDALEVMEKTPVSLVLADILGLAREWAESRASNAFAPGSRAFTS